MRATMERLFAILGFSSLLFATMVAPVVASLSPERFDAETWASPTVPERAIGAPVDAMVFPAYQPWEILPYSSWAGLLELPLFSLCGLLWGTALYLAALAKIRRVRRTATEGEPA
jgi:hypothetical protein